MNYGADIFEMYRQVGVYGRPAGAAVDQVPFVINRKTAKALGLEIPGGAEGVRD